MDTLIFIIFGTIIFVAGYFFSQNDPSSEYYNLSFKGHVIVVIISITSSLALRSCNHCDSSKIRLKEHEEMQHLFQEIEKLKKIQQIDQQEDHH